MQPNFQWATQTPIVHCSSCQVISACGKAASCALFCMQAMPKAVQNHTFTSFLKQYGLDLQSAEYVSAEYRPGVPMRTASA